MWQGWVNGLLGIWLVITPFYGAYRSFYIWNDFVCGLIIGILGLSMIGIKTWQGWVCFIVGVWVFISMFIPGLHTGSGVYISNIISGVAAIIGGFGATMYSTRAGYRRTIPSA